MRQYLLKAVSSFALLGAFGLLAGCGDSKVTSTPVNRNDAGPTWVKNEYAPYPSFLHRCAAPRTGTNPATGKPFEDGPGSTSLEKFALRSFSRQTYLWASQLVEDYDPTTSLNPQAYFELLKIPADKFHFYISSEENYKEFILGKSLSYGITWFRDSNEEIVVAYVERNSPAEAAGVMRGYRVVLMDGLVESALSREQFLAAIYPSEQSPSHRFTFKNSQGVQQPEVRLNAAEIQVNSVQNLQYFTTANERKVAYFSFGSFNGTAEKELINAVNDIKQTGAQELILDLRFNGGGYLDLASELAYMLAGDGVKNTPVFSALRFAPGNTVYKDELLPFLRTTQGLSSEVAKDQPLPTLNLKRLYVLTSPSTCSASESLINGLRGADFPVVQVGTTTCGKPYGMIPLSNCGFDYYTINFLYENAKGFSDFADGIAPRNSVQTQGSPLGCELADQYRDPLGSANESLLAAALKHLESGSCGTSALAAPRRSASPLQHPNPAFSNAIAPRLSF